MSNMAAPPPPPPRTGLSLYDNLLDPKDAASATISSAPVLYNQADAASSDASLSKKPVDPALRFQPIRRPQPKQAKPKASFPKAIPKPAAAAPAAAAPVAAAAPTASAPPKSTLADWAAAETDEWQYGVGEKRQRGGRKQKKKKRQQVQAETDWDELYDPSRPTNVEEYLKSDERVDEVREWKSLLYRHRRKRDESDLSDEEDEGTRPMAPSKCISNMRAGSFTKLRYRSICSSSIVCLRTTAPISSSSSTR